MSELTSSAMGKIEMVFGETETKMGAGEKVWVLPGGGGGFWESGGQNPYICNTGEKYLYYSKYIKHYVIISFIEKR